MTKLGEFIKQIRGVSYKPEDVYDELTDESVALLRANNIKDGRLDFQDVIYVRKGCVKENQYLRFGDILVCTSSGSKDLVGKAAFVDHDLPMTFGAFCKVVRTTSGVPQYFGHFFDSPYYRRKISDASAGANINNIRNEHIDEIEIQLPSLDVQQQIISVLNKTNYLISLRKQQLDKLDELVKARFVEMFGDPINNSKELPGTSFINVVQLQRGYDLPVQNRQLDGNVPVFGSNGILDYHNVAKVTGGGIITGRSGTIGNVYYTVGDYWPLNTTLFSVDLHGNNIVYLAYLLKLFDLSRFADGTGVPTLNRNNVHNKKIIDVPIQQQNEFAMFVEKIEKCKLTIRQGLDKLEMMKKALMQRYFG